MEIIINGQQAYLKKNTSFEYISENPLFTGSDSYTLTITFPLKDCPENIRIFGHLHRQDVEKNKVVFDCDIRDKDFFKSGSIVITQISEVEVKTQFLEGRSEQNFDETFDDVYLNQLNLGYPDAEQRKPSSMDAQTAWNVGYPVRKWVALPWVNNTSGNLQNAVEKDSNGKFQWASDLRTLTFQPYLLHILNKICQVTGYQGDFEALERSRYKYMIICNTLPATWGAWNFALALPHWSLTEFFEELEKLTGGEFSINHKAKTITFEFSHKLAYKTKDVHIEKVVSKYTVDVSREYKSDYLGSMNRSYVENDNRMWAYKSCQWYIEEHKKSAKVYDTLNELLDYAMTKKECGVETHATGRGGTSTAYSRGYPGGSDAHGLFYAKDVDTYFIFWCYKSELVHSVHLSGSNTDYKYYKYTNRLIPVNQFGKLLVDKKADTVEMNIVPAWLDYTDEEMGICLFLECGEMGSAVTWTEETDQEGNTTVSKDGNNGRRRAMGDGRVSDSSEPDEEDYNEGALAQTKTGRAIAKGEQKKTDAYFDKLYVGFWMNRNTQANGGLPHPMVDKIEINDDFSVNHGSYSLRINQQEEKDKDGVPLKYTYDIDNRKKYSFSFLSDEIPDARALFYIEGRKYVCEKITATFHEGSGRSQLLKGVFYRVI